MLTDVIDGTLSAADQAQFDLHVAGCTACTAMLADARRGVAWLEMLADVRPEPRATLLDQILSKTTGPLAGASESTATAKSNALLSVPAGSPMYPAAAVSGPAKVLPFRQRLFNAFGVQNIRQAVMQPRLAMTAAMAFFSIALTLNLTGVRISDLRLSDLKPSSIRRNFWAVNAHVARTLDNMRVVYELESRVRDLQRTSDADSPAAAPQNQNTQPPDSSKPEDNNTPQQKRTNPRSKSGSSRRETPDSRLLMVSGRLNARNNPGALMYDENGMCKGPATLLFEAGTSPAAATRAFNPFIPNVFSKKQEGGMV
jgi:hypothetical protein